MIKVGSRVLLAPFYLKDSIEHGEAMLGPGQTLTIDEPAQIGTVVSINVTGPDEMEVQLDPDFIDEEDDSEGLREVPTNQITEIPE